LRATSQGYMPHKGRMQRSRDIMASYFSEIGLYPLTQNAQSQLPLDCYSESSFKDSPLHASGKHDTLFLCCLATHKDLFTSSLLLLLDVPLCLATYCTN